MNRRRGVWTTIIIAALLGMTARPVAAGDQQTSRTTDVSTLVPQLRQMEIAPYRVSTDASAADVTRVLDILADLRRQFETQFAALCRPALEPRPIEVLFFSREEDFSRYARQVAPALQRSAGFFCTRENKLALVNQRDAAPPRSLASLSGSFPSTPGASRFLPSLRSGAETTLMTERVIRHEGAHQLFSHYRIHSAFALEPTWLTEGLAEYCATARIGGLHGGHVERLQVWQRQGRLLPLEMLLNHRDADGFFSLDVARAEVAYAQSWSLVHLLMTQPRFQQGFESLIRVYSETKATDARRVEDTEPLQILLEHLQLTFSELGEAWMSSLGDVR